MKVTLLNQCFYPDVVATGQHLTDLAVALAERGHQVTVITSRQGYDDPRMRFVKRERWQGIDIVRLPSSALGKTARWRRAIDFATLLIAYVLRLAITPRQDVVIALTADHGLTPFPEVHVRDPNNGATRVNVRPVLQRLSNGLATAGVPGYGLNYFGGYTGNGFSFDGGVLELNKPALAKAKINQDSLLRALRADFLSIRGVARADRISELARSDTLTDKIARRWLHMFDNEEKAAMVVTLAPYNYWASISTTAQHGSPNDSDAQVPIIFYGAKIKPGRYPEFARVVDMAPTLAALAHVIPLEKLDGHVLQNAIK